LMNAHRVNTVLLVAALLATCGASAWAASGASRLPWSDVQELLRLEVMGPNVEAPVREYLLSAAAPIGVTERAELEALGIELVSVAGETAVVRGRLTAFSGLYGEGESLGWVRSVLPHLPIEYSSSAVQYYWVDIEYALSHCGVGNVPDDAGSGLLVAVVDGGFTGALQNALGSDRVHYVQMRSPTKDSSEMEIIAGREYGQHGTMCAEAIAAMVPEAEFLLCTTRDSISKVEMMRLIAEGAVIQVGEQSIDLSQIDLVSDSTFSPYPQDHNDGRGALATTADAIVGESVPYIYALGNFAEGEDTTRGFFSGKYEDVDGNLFHDFDPGSDAISDRNSLAITVEPWEEDRPAIVTVILEWDGWLYQIGTGAPVWTRDEIVSIQDIDLYVFPEDPETGVMSAEYLNKAATNQLDSLSVGGALLPADPVEALQFEVTEPGTYFLMIKNATTCDRPGLEARDVDMHLYVHASGGQFTMEHSTSNGAFLNIGGAENVIGVGAVGFTLDETWCLMDYSSRGPTSDGRLKPELVAPTMYGSELEDQVFTGTSASAPLLAGIVAWLLDEVPQASPAQLREAMCQTAQPLTGTCNSASVPSDCGLCSQSCNCGVGCGMIDAEAALAYLRAIVD